MPRENGNIEKGYILGGLAVDDKRNTHNITITVKQTEQGDIIEDWEDSLYSVNSKQKNLPTAMTRENNSLPLSEDSMQRQSALANKIISQPNIEVNSNQPQNAT
ncbi:MAG: hypothetical protein GX800_04705, partial [Clostridiaceae bacterium]|nr:hypothetical protein [Clostridiaceae bacterium]